MLADMKVEDADTYRFLATNIGGELVIVADGRTPFEVFHDDHFLGNHRLANCSKYLKQKPWREWLDADADSQRHDPVCRHRWRDAPRGRHRCR